VNFNKIKPDFKKVRRELQGLLSDGKNQSEEARIFREIQLESIDYVLKYPRRFLLSKITGKKLDSPRYHVAMLAMKEKALIEDGIFRVGGIKFDLRDIDPIKFLGIFFCTLESVAPYAFALEVDKDYDIYPVLSPAPAISEGPYERRNVKIENGDIVIDAGAFNGDFSALAALKGAAGYAFEPSSIVYEKLLLPTVKINAGLPGKFIPVRKGLSDKTGSITIGRVEEFGTGASLSSDCGEGKTEEVELTTVDAFAHENNLPSVDFIKADIEGAERLMLAGARGVLKDFAPKIAVCTYHLPDDKEVLEDIVREANPKYVVEHKYKKMYCHVPK
jgi:FkbM family methyltransferase